MPAIPLKPRLPVGGSRLLIAAGAVVVVLFVLWSSAVYSIDQSERGVVLTNGAVSGVAQPGLHLKLPVFQSVVRIPVTQQVTYWNCANNASADSCPAGDHREMQAYSQDQQPADMRVSVTWHVPESEVQELYSQYRSLEALDSRLISRRAPQDLKTIFGQFTAVSVIQNRTKFNDQVQAAVEQDIKGPVVIDSVQIENIDFSETYEKSVEAAMQARVEVQRLEQQQQQQEVQAKITVINATAEAQAKLAQAKADAEATRVRGEAEAAAIKAQADALKNNPGLPAYLTAKNWDGHLPTTMIPGATVPMIAVNQAPQDSSPQK